MRFVCVPIDDWGLNKFITRTRCHRLLGGIPFDEIVARIAAGMSATFKREQPRKHPGCRRVIITLTGNPNIVDLFHNSRCGYRAQYYHSLEAGEYANRYAIDELMPMVRKALESKPNRLCPRPWVEQSLLHRNIKMWIHQGRWMRPPRYACRNLSVERWLKPVECGDEGTRKKLQKRQIFGQLTPQYETSIEIKGPWEHPTGNIPREFQKPNRGQHIHDLGFI